MSDQKVTYTAEQWAKDVHRIFFDDREDGKRSIYIRVMRAEGYLEEEDRLDFENALREYFKAKARFLQGTPDPSYQDLDMIEKEFFQLRDKAEKLEIDIYKLEEEMELSSTRKLDAWVKIIWQSREGPLYRTLEQLEKADEEGQRVIIDDFFRKNSDFSHFQSHLKNYQNAEGDISEDKHIGVMAVVHHLVSNLKGYGCEWDFEADFFPGNLRDLLNEFDRTVPGNTPVWKETQPA